MSGRLKRVAALMKKRYLTNLNGCQGRNCRQPQFLICAALPKVIWFLAVVAKESINAQSPRDVVHCRCYRPIDSCGAGAAFPRRARYHGYACSYAREIRRPDRKSVV